MQIVKYTDEKEKEDIIKSKESQGLLLVETANITEGNFLGFVETADYHFRSTPEIVKILKEEGRKEIRNAAQEASDETESNEELKTKLREKGVIANK